MTPAIDVVWTTTSSHLNCFDQPLLKQLRQQATIAQWQYQQTEDEPCSLDMAVDLLHDYVMQGCEKPVHLIGHGTGGLVSLLYARRCPQKVKSLTLLGVGAQATIDWMAHYYFHLQFVSGDRRHVLTQLVPALFGELNPKVTCYLAKLLDGDMAVSPSPHTLMRRFHLPACGVPVPLLVCGCETDPVVDSQALKEWEGWMKECDRIWQCREGHHFFHCFHPQPVAEQVLSFWQNSTVGSTCTEQLKSCLL